MSKEMSLLPSEAEWKLSKEMVLVFIKTGMLPSAIKTPEQAMLVAIKGREMGIPMLHAFAHIHVIQGKPTISSELMLALIYKNIPGAIVDFLETTNSKCVIEAKRPGGKPSLFIFSMEDAKLAGMTGKDNWHKHPAAMLRARCVSAMARAVFPDALMGCSYVPEEMGADYVEGGGEPVLVSERVLQDADETIKLAKEFASEIRTAPVLREQTPEIEKDLPPEVEVKRRAHNMSRMGGADWKITEPQRKRLYAIGYSNGWTHDDVRDHLLKKYNLGSAEDLKVKLYDEVCAYLQANAKIKEKPIGPGGAKELLASLGIKEKKKEEIPQSDVPLPQENEIPF